MNREILFRGLRINGKGWVYGYYWIINEHFTPTLSGINYIKSINNGVDYEIIPESLGQFTGLLDKNGVKIFEGDLIHYDNTPYCVNGLKIDGKVVYYKGSWAIEYQATFTKEFYLMRKLFSSEDFIGKKSKVIGNIHE